MRFQIELINKNTLAIEEERNRFAQINDDSTEMISQINELQTKYKAELQ